MSLRITILSSRTRASHIPAPLITGKHAYCYTILLAYTHNKYSHPNDQNLH